MINFKGIALCQNSGAQIRNLEAVPCYTCANVSRETLNYFNALFHVKHFVNACFSIVSRETSSFTVSHYFNSLFHVKHAKRFVSRETSKKVKV